MVGVVYGMLVRQFRDVSPVLGWAMSYSRGAIQKGCLVVCWVSGFYN